MAHVIDNPIHPSGPAVALEPDEWIEWQAGLAEACAAYRGHKHAAIDRTQGLGLHPVEHTELGGSG